MTYDPALDDAIQVATVRTVDAQVEVGRSIDAPDILPDKLDVAVFRAEDLHVGQRGRRRPRRLGLNSSSS